MEKSGAVSFETAHFFKTIPYTYAAKCAGFVLQINRGVHAVHIALIEPFPQKLDGFAKSLEVHDLPLPQELDHIVHIRIVTEPKNVVIRDSRLLLCCNCVRITALKNPVFMRVCEIAIFG